MLDLAGYSDAETSVVRFLLHEASLLNDRRYDEWLDLITDDFEYRMPSPCVQDDPTQPQYDEQALLSWESTASLRLRFERLASDFAWADRPPPKERRHVTSARLVAETDGPPARELVVASDVLVARSRRPDGTYLTSAGRRDVLRLVDGELRLADRRVYIDLERPSVSQISVLY
jgi:3-phenylpropionate/cinnamic acid dioxygenase small subunit